jgi:signal transduction histidine kinase
LHYNQNENYLIYSNEVALEQIFINLLSNAKDAILEKKIINGKVDVCLEISLDKKFLKIKVEDNGIGMTKDIQEKIFNPFFTTKEVGKGMGLGLSISYGLLQQLHGSIMVSSKLGVGSVFTVQLPLNPKNF